MNSGNQSMARNRPQSLGPLAAKQTSSEIFYGWRVVVVSALGPFWGIPIAVYSFSVFFKP